MRVAFAPSAYSLGLATSEQWACAVGPESAGVMS